MQDATNDKGPGMPSEPFEKDTTEVVKSTAPAVTSKSIIERFVACYREKRRAEAQLRAAEYELARTAGAFIGTGHDRDRFPMFMLFPIQTGACTFAAGTYDGTCATHLCPFWRDSEEACSWMAEGTR